MADNSAIVALTSASAKSGNNNSEVVALNTAPAKSDNNDSAIVALTSASAAPAKSDNNNSEVVGLTAASAALTNAIATSAKNDNNNSAIVALNTAPTKSDNNNSAIVALTAASADLTNAIASPTGTPAKSDNNNSEIVALTAASAALTNAIASPTGTPAKNDNNNSAIVALTSAIAANNNTLAEPKLIQKINLKQEQTELENISKSIPYILFREYEKRLYQTLKTCLNKEIDDILKKTTNELKKNVNKLKKADDELTKIKQLFDIEQNIISNFFSHITKEWLLTMDNLYTTVYKKIRNNSYFTTQYLKYIVEYNIYKKIYESLDKLSLQITPDQFEQFAYIDHHADADDVFYGKQPGGARTKNKIIKEVFKSLNDGISQGANYVGTKVAKGANYVETKTVDAYNSAKLKSNVIGRRITDIRKAYDEGNVHFKPETDILKIIGPDRFDFTRKYNDNVWFLAVCIFDPNLQYFHLKDWTMEDVKDWTMEDEKVKPRFFLNFTKEIGSYNTFQYLTRRNVIGFDEKTNTIDLGKNIFSGEYTDAVIDTISKKIVEAKGDKEDKEGEEDGGYEDGEGEEDGGDGDEYEGEGGGDGEGEGGGDGDGEGYEDDGEGYEDEGEGYEDEGEGGGDGERLVNEKLKTDLTTMFVQTTPMRVWLKKMIDLKKSLSEKPYYPENYQFDTKITPELGVPFLLVGRKTPEGRVEFYPDMTDPQVVLLLDREAFIRYMYNKERAREEEEEKAKLLSLIMATQKNTLKTDDNAEHENQEKMATLALVAGAEEERRRKEAEEAEHQRKKAEDEERIKQERMAILALMVGAEEERRRKEAEEERMKQERMAMLSIVVGAEEERRRKEAEAEERRRREEERKRKEAEEERIKQERMATMALVVGSEAERKKKEAEEERIKQERMATLALVIGSEEDRKRKEAEEERIKQERMAILALVVGSEAERRRKEAEEEEERIKQEEEERRKKEEERRKKEEEEERRKKEEEERIKQEEEEERRKKEEERIKQERMAILALVVGAEAERLRKEEDEERRKKEEEERIKQERMTIMALVIGAEEERRRKEAEEERIKKEKMAIMALVVGADIERRRKEADAEEKRRRREAEEERIKQERMTTLALVIGEEEERRRREEEERRRREEKKLSAILSVVLASMSKDKNSRLFDYINVLFIKNNKSLSTIIDNAKKILFYYICYKSVNIYIDSYFTTTKAEEKTLLKTYIELKNKINKLKELQNNTETIKTLVSDARIDFYDIAKNKSKRKSERTEKEAANSFFSNIKKFQEYYIKKISGYADYIDYIITISDELFTKKHKKLVDNCKNGSKYVRSLVDYEKIILSDITKSSVNKTVKETKSFADEIGKKLTTVSDDHNYLKTRLKLLVNLYNKINNTKSDFHNVCSIDNNLILDNNIKNKNFDNALITTKCREYIGIDNGGRDSIWYVDLFQFLNDNFMAESLILETNIDNFINDKIKTDNRKTLVINTNDTLYDKQFNNKDLNDVNNPRENISDYLTKLNILKNNFLLNITDLKDQVVENNNINITEMLEIKQKIKEKLKSDKNIGTGFDSKKYDNNNINNVYCETHIDDTNTTKELEKIGFSKIQSELSPYLQHIYEKCFSDSNKDEDKLFKNNFHFLMIVPYIREKIFDGISPELKECIIKKINESLNQYNVNNNNVNNNNVNNNNVNNNVNDSEFILNNQANITDLTITDNNIYDLQNIFDDINSKITEIEEKSTNTSIVNNDQGQGEGKEEGVEKGEGKEEGVEKGKGKGKGKGEGVDINPDVQKQGRLNLRA